MAKSAAKVVCPHCRTALKIPKKRRGKSGKCPRCGMVVSFAAGKKNLPKRVNIQCDNCESMLSLPAAKVGKTVTCPQCQKKIQVSVDKIKLLTATSLRDHKLAAETEDPGALRVGQVKRETRNLWRELELAQRDSYWLATGKACLYPFQALGALIFFVVGVPVALAVIEWLAKFILRQAGDALEEEISKSVFSGAVVAAGMAAALALLAFYCSFLFAVVRTSAVGRTAIPVIEGMHHRSNLAATLSWAALYFGPGLLLGSCLAGEGEAFSWSVGTVAALVLPGLVAPMGFLCSATVSAVTGLNVVRVVAGIMAVLNKYAYMLLVIILAAGFFGGLGFWVGLKASAAMAAEKTAIGFAWRVFSGLLLMFPPVIGARCLGLLIKYHEKALPFTLDLFSEHRGSLLPQLVAVAGLALIFMPFFSASKLWMKEGGESFLARRHLRERIYEKLKGGYTGERRRHPRNLAELEQYLGKKQLKCPIPGKYQDTYPFYGLVPLFVEAKRWPRLIWIYEKKPTHPDGKTLNAQPYAAAMIAVTQKQLDKILKLQEQHGQAKDQKEKEKIYRQIEVESRGL